MHGHLEVPSVKVKLTTNWGTIIIELDEENAPITVDNFAGYVIRGHYDNTIFHRVIDGFMIQAGGMGADMKPKQTEAPILCEADNGLSNLTSTVAMARLPDPHSATAQFYINVADNTLLDYREPTKDGWGYCVFGRVIQGMDVVNSIKKVKTSTRAGHQNVPVEDIVIQKAELLNA
ncbi:MAG: peptidyl-prolyl cis-trans isomerase [Gammaproteobacteria bacterium]|nr:peptidyl-prolyl cis-trans isomerase [Gammaproteobacteria bacterium]